MKLSWSHKLFLAINGLHKKWPIVDHVMILCAHWAIYFVAIIALLAIRTYSPISYVIVFSLLTTWGLALGTSYGIAYLFPHPRPHVEFPHIDQLVPLYHFEEWKSFPSDHTITSWLFALVASSLGAPMILTVTLIGLAVLVSVGRVYVGVHYPRDIVGGIVLAVIFFGLWKFFMIV